MGEPRPPIAWAAADELSAFPDAIASGKARSPALRAEEHRTQSRFFGRVAIANADRRRTWCVSPAKRACVRCQRRRDVFIASLWKQTHKIDSAHAMGGRGFASVATLQINCRACHLPGRRTTT